MMEIFMVSSLYVIEVIINADGDGIYCNWVPAQFVEG